ncbi:MAG: MoaD/ThiS family protein [Sphingobacteriaceae bacterium]|jgi:sulfur-carrier protein|nr:MoaD/ThiS family protein [Sphingobacteriaceae bacterium]
MEDIRIDLYGVLAEIAGKQQLIYSNIKDIHSLKKKVNTNFPEMDAYNYIIAINNMIVHENVQIPLGSSIALMPPFSGG